MVSTKADKRKTLNLNKNTKLIRVLVFCSVFILIETILLTILTIDRTFNDDVEVHVPDTPDITDIIIPTPVLPNKIDFQPVIDEWVKQTSGDKSVVMYDLDRNEIVGEYNKDTPHLMASLYKLFIAYEGYLRLQSGEWEADALCGSSGKTIRECLDLVIRESDSVCAEILWSMIGRTELNMILEQKFSFQGFNLNNFVATPEEILKVMMIYYDHKELVDDSLVAQMKDSFLNQPITNYNWRQGLPSGFNRANVYNKVGWEYDEEEKRWNIYNDAAIIEFPEDNRHFVVVVMTNYTPYQSIRQLGTSIENYYYNQ